MAETITRLERAGFQARRNRETARWAERSSADVSTYDLRRGKNEHIVLEVWAYADGDVRYYLAILRFHGLSSTSFRLDSWKHHADRVEFKFYALAGTGMGLSLVLSL